MKTCPRCNTQHEKNGVYCSRSCANARIQTPEINAKRSKTNRATWKKRGKEILKNRKAISKEISEKRIATYQKTFMEADFETLAVGTRRRRVLIEQDNKCLHCGISTWQGQKITLELDHVDGNNKNHARENMRYLCPNCHALTPTWRGRNLTGDKNSRRKHGPVA